MKPTIMSIKLIFDWGLKSTRKICMHKMLAENPILYSIVMISTEIRIDSLLLLFVMAQ